MWQVQLCDLSLTTSCLHTHSDDEDIVTLQAEILHGEKPSDKGDQLDAAKVKGDQVKIDEPESGKVKGDMAAAGQDKTDATAGKSSKKAKKKKKKGGLE